MAQFCRQRLFEGVIERGIARAVGEIGDYDRVFLGEFRSAMKEEVAAGDENDECNARNCDYCLAFPYGSLYARSRFGGGRSPR